MIPWLEIRRKIMHTWPIIIPIAYRFVSKDTALTIMLPICALYVFCDIFRHFHEGFRQLFDRIITVNFLREHEKNGLIGSSYFIFGALLAIILFPKPVTIASLYILIISDAMAAIVGTGWGKTRIFAKSLEGSIAFFVSGIVIVLLAMQDKPLWGESAMQGHLGWGVLAVAGATLVELFPTGLDDNLTIPVVAGAIMMFGFWI
ncbi:MAG: SEC59/DGK1/VTE5 family protein [Deltaproteobacteria bacterium]|nr:SEC59/DGK1/VTE5 family protein [Deltaproteobacteria bacterium]